MDRNESCKQAYRVHTISLSLGIVQAWGSSNADCSTFTSASENAANTTWFLEIASLTFSTIPRTWTVLGELTESSFVEGKQTNIDFTLSAGKVEVVLLVASSHDVCNCPWYITSRDHNEDRTKFQRAFPIPSFYNLCSTLWHTHEWIWYSNSTRI